MSYINHLRQNSGQNIVHSQSIKFAGVLVSSIVVILIVVGWLFIRDEKILLSDSAFTIISEAVVTIAIFTILIWKGTSIIKNACSQRDKAINALEENEAKFIRVVDASHNGIVFVNADGNICIANDEFLRITGYTDSCLQAGLNWFNITPSEYLDIDKHNFSQAKAAGSCKPYEKELVCADGTQVAVKVSCTVSIKTKPDTYIINVSERNQIEQKLSYGQQWLEHLFDVMPAPLLLIEPGTARVIFANKAADEMAGGKFPLAQSQEEYSELYGFTNAQGKLMKRVALGERLQGVEINWRKGDDIYPLQVFADALPPMHGYPATSIVLFRDITKLKQLETSLSLGQDRLELLFETTSDLISSEQPKELIEVLYGEIAQRLGIDCYLYYSVDTDSQAIQLTNYSGITFSEATYFESQKFGEGICGTVAAKRSATKIENVLKSNDPNTESIRNLGMNAYYCCPLIAQGQLLGTISFGSRTRSDFASYEIGMMQAVCNQIAIAIQRANLIDSLQKANCIKDEFLAILSHELRSPLNSILGWAQYLRVRKLDETTTSKALESIERNSRELHNVIEELLDVSRIIQGKMQLNIRSINLASIIVAAIENLRSTSIAKQIEIKLSVHKGFGMEEHIGNLPFTNYEASKFASLNQIPADYEAILKRKDFLIAGDDERLKQVIWNLLSNAIKFTSCGGCIEVRLLEDKTSNSLSYAVIEVSDTGIGIDSEFLPYVFDRFRQGDSSNARAHNGLGLGLAIVRHIVELHGGSVSVESPGEGKGSKFTVKLPLIKSTQSQPAKKNCERKFLVIN
ncbi:MAG: ATP-binding protein [Rivularia sp. (in: cyanobacteria)]